MINQAPRNLSDRNANPPQQCGHIAASEGNNGFITHSACARKKVAEKHLTQANVHAAVHAELGVTRGGSSGAARVQPPVRLETRRNAAGVRVWSQTLSQDRWQTDREVPPPLMPGLYTQPSV